MLRVLDPVADARLVQVRDLLGEIRDALVRFDATPEDRGLLVASIRQLDELFLIVVVGEFNAGKSAFINALVGERLMQEGVTPTTARLHLLKYGDGDTASSPVTDEGVQVIAAPIDLLRDVHIVDTPGTNAIIREHERLTTHFVPRSDLVLFVTSADRPFTESERAFLQVIRDWGKKIAIVVNKADILTPVEAEEVQAFVKQAASTLLGTSPQVLMVSARLAFRAKRGEPSLWAASGFDALESYLRQTLDPDVRFNLKLANPLGVGGALAERYASIARERLRVMQEDIAGLEAINRQLAVFHDDVQRGFELRMSAIERDLGELESRGRRFFDSTLRIGRFFDLLNRARVQKEFEDQVVADLPTTIERRVTELVQWLVDQELRQWQAITTRLVDRHRQDLTGVPGAPDVGTFHTARLEQVRLLESEAQRVVATYDTEREAAAIADQARVAVAAAAATGGAAVGLGAVIAALASTVAVDVTGIVLASAVLGVGFLIIPARRRRANVLLAEKVADLRRRLAQILRAEFSRAQEQSRQRLDDVIAPYARFVRAEQQRWLDAERSLGITGDRAQAMLSAIRGHRGIAGGK
jgi:small GTP-binding protein